MSKTLDIQTFELVVELDTAAQGHFISPERKVFCLLAAQHLATLRGQAKNGRELGARLRDYLEYLKSTTHLTLNFARDAIIARNSLIAGLTKLVG